LQKFTTILFFGFHIFKYWKKSDKIKT